MLADYVTEGGKLLVMAGPTEDDGLENLYSLLLDYGVEAQEGIVVETDRMHYAFQRPYILLPFRPLSHNLPAYPSPLWKYHWPDCK